MQIIVTFPSGFDVDGIVLSIKNSSLRVAMRDWDDATEFECRDGLWYAENGDAVIISWSDPSDAEFAECLAAESFSDARLQTPASTWVN